MLSGHKLAWTKAGVLHRDVSIGNVLLVDGNGEARFVGFLHDFDYSSMMDAPPQNTESEPEDGEVEADDLPLSEDPEDVDGLESGGAVVIAVDDLRKERTVRDVCDKLNCQSELIGLVQGTFYFMATEILEERVVHHVRHDLESFHWVLLWAVIRHTAHSYSLKEAQGVFIFGEDQAAAGRKRLWFERDSRRFNIPGNKPLVKLLQDFGMLAYKSLGSLLVPPQYMTYDDVLKIFNDALDSPGWPEDDIVPCKWFDRRSGAAIPGVTSDNYDNKPIPAPQNLKAKTASAAQGSRSGMAPSLGAIPEGAETRSRSKRRREGAHVPRNEPGPSSRTTSSGKRLRTTRSGAAGSSNAPQRVTRSATAGSSGTTQRATRSAAAGSSRGTTPAGRQTRSQGGTRGR